MESSALGQTFKLHHGGQDNILTGEYYYDFDIYDVIDPYVYGIADAISLIPIPLVSSVGDGLGLIYSTYRGDVLNQSFYTIGVASVFGTAYFKFIDNVYGNLYVVAAKRNTDDGLQLIARRIDDLPADEIAVTTARSSDNATLLKTEFEKSTTIKENISTFVRQANGVVDDLATYINQLLTKNIRNAILELPESRFVAQKYFNRIIENPTNYLSEYTLHLNDFDAWYANVFKSELFEAHHIIPKNVLRDNANLQSILDWARNNGKSWDFGDIDNGIMLQKRRKNNIGEVVGDHANHPEYDRQIREKINQIYNENSGNLSDAYDDFIDFVNDLKQQINAEVVEGNQIINTITIP